MRNYRQLANITCRDCTLQNCIPILGFAIIPRRLSYRSNLSANASHLSLCRSGQSTRGSLQTECGKRSIKPEMGPNSTPLKKEYTALIFFFQGGVWRREVRLKRQKRFKRNQFSAERPSAGHPCRHMAVRAANAPRRSPRRQGKCGGTNTSRLHSGRRGRRPPTKKEPTIRRGHMDSSMEYRDSPRARRRRTSSRPRDLNQNG